MYSFDSGVTVVMSPEWVGVGMPIWHDVARCD